MPLIIQRGYLPPIGLLQKTEELYNSVKVMKEDYSLFWIVFLKEPMGTKNNCIFIQNEVLMKFITNKTYRENRLLPIAKNVQISDLVIVNQALTNKERYTVGGVEVFCILVSPKEDKALFIDKAGDLFTLSLEQFNNRVSYTNSVFKQKTIPQYKECRNPQWDFSVFRAQVLSDKNTLNKYANYLVEPEISLKVYQEYLLSNSTKDMDYQLTKQLKEKEVGTMPVMFEEGSIYSCKEWGTDFKVVSVLQDTLTLQQVNEGATFVINEEVMKDLTVTLRDHSMSFSKDFLNALLGNEGVAGAKKLLLEGTQIASVGVGIPYSTCAVDLNEVCFFNARDIAHACYLMVGDMSKYEDILEILLADLGEKKVPMDLAINYAEGILVAFFGYRPFTREEIALELQDSRIHLERRNKAGYDFLGFQFEGVTYDIIAPYLSTYALEEKLTEMKKSKTVEEVLEWVNANTLRV